MIIGADLFLRNWPCTSETNLLTPHSEENHTGAVVAFTNVKIGFEEGDVLRGVSFEVMSRETLVLLGRPERGRP